MRALFHRCKSVVVSGDRSERCMLKQGHDGVHAWWQGTRFSTDTSQWTWWDEDEVSA